MTRPLRPLLLLLVAFGVLGMHTLGHVSAGHGATAAHGARPVAHAEQPMTGPPGPIAIGSGAVLRFDPGDVCLAVLTSAAMLLLAAAWAATLRRPARTTVTGPWPAGVARSPPRRWAASLLRLSVLRI